MAHYLITGHTGFKGAWLIFLLKARGHEVSGLALDPLPGSLFERADLAQDLTHDFRVDIRDREKTHKAFQEVQPDYVIHMAAQALVREGYRNPLLTYETNVSGTLNVLQAVEETNSVRAQLIVTTDKVYLNRGLNRPYVETDSLGGKDPYSASKAMADILSQEWLGRDGATPGAIARAGNVIGAGDISVDRLIPDIVRATESRKKIDIRYPKAIRPWQHVLDCLNGYLTILAEVEKESRVRVWNIGPKATDSHSVEQVVQQAHDFLGLPVVTFNKSVSQPPEESYLLLDAERANNVLGWRDKLSFELALKDSLAEAMSAQAWEPRKHIQRVTFEFEALDVEEVR